MGCGGGLVVLLRGNKALTVSGSGSPRGVGGKRRYRYPSSDGEMLGYGASELGSMEGEEAVEAPGPAPEPRAPEPRAPEPEPGLDLSLSPSPLPESPERRGGSPGRRKGRRGGGRRGRQVSGGVARPPAGRASRTPPLTVPPSALRFDSTWRRPPRSAPSRCSRPVPRATIPRRRSRWRWRPRRAAWP